MPAWGTTTWRRTAPPSMRAKRPALPAPTSKATRALARPGRAQIWAPTRIRSAGHTQGITTITDGGGARGEHRRSPAAARRCAGVEPAIGYNISSGSLGKGESDAAFTLHYDPRKARPSPRV